MMASDYISLRSSKISATPRQLQTASLCTRWRLELLSVPGIERCRNPNSLAPVQKDRKRTCVGPLVALPSGKPT